MVQNTTVVLYFINTKKPSAADETRAAHIPGIVRYRNVNELAVDNVEACDFVTASNGVSIPSQYSAKTVISSEKPTALQIVPDAPSIDLSDVEPLRLRAMATFPDGSLSDVTELCTWVSSLTGKATVSDVALSKGKVAPVGTGATVITATYPFAAPGVAGVAYGASIGTFSGIPTADQVIVLGDISYTWKATVANTSSATAVQVKIGADKYECARNFMRAVMGRGGKGTLFSDDVHVNAKAVAVLDADDLSIVHVTAIAPGTVGNAVATTKTASNFAWTGSTLASGANATSGVADTNTVTVVA